MARRKEQLTVGRRQVTVSNLDKVLYPGTRFLIVWQMPKRLRTKKVFIDWSQNTDYKTTVSRS